VKKLKKKGLRSDEGGQTECGAKNSLMARQNSRSLRGGGGAEKCRKKGHSMVGRRAARKVKTRDIVAQKEVGNLSPQEIEEEGKEWGSTTIQNRGTLHQKPKTASGHGG